MRATFALATLAGLVASVTAQGLNNLPSCAINCVSSSIGVSGCNSSDFTCLCKSQPFLDAELACVQKTCSAADLQTAESAAVQLCQTFGVSVAPPSGSSTAAGSSGSGASASASAPSGSGSSSPPASTSASSSSASAAPSAKSGAGSVVVPAFAGVVALAAGAVIF